MNTVTISLQDYNKLKEYEDIVKNKKPYYMVYFYGNSKTYYYYLDENNEFENHIEEFNRHMEESNKKIKDLKNDLNRYESNIIIKFLKLVGLV